MEKPTPNEQAAWEKIASAPDQVAAYYLWCHEVLQAQEAGLISQSQAAGMMRFPQDDREFDALEQSADAQIVMDYAADIVDGGAYMIRPDSLESDWTYITAVVYRHLNKHDPD